MADANLTRRAHNFKDITGKVFGRLTVVAYAKSSARGRAIWLCMCTCGNPVEVLGYCLRRSKSTQSCGCLHSDVLRLRNMKHGYGTRDNCLPEYRIWKGAKKRCVNPNDTKFEHYGGRGITMCERWKNSFVAFLEDMGRRPENIGARKRAEYSIDRKNNDGHYSCGKCEECIANNWPANCRWATQMEQVKNQRR